MLWIEGSVNDDDDLSGTVVDCAGIVAVADAELSAAEVHGSSDLAVGQGSSFSPERILALGRHLALAMVKAFRVFLWGRSGNAATDEHRRG